MKTIINYQKSLPWEKEKSSLSHWLSRQLSRIPSLPALMTKFWTLLQMVAVSAHKAMTAGLVAVLKSATVNYRIYTGLVLIGVIAPLSMVAYQLFDSTIDDKDWYHGNYYYLFHVLGPYLFQAFFILGMYHLFPQGAKRSYVLSLPLGYTIAKSILIILCTSNEEWHQAVPLAFVALGAGISIVLFVSIDFFAWRKFHKFDSIPARIKGIINLPGVDASTKLTLIEKENEKLFTFHKEF